MIQNFTPNDLVKILYEPKEGLDQLLNAEECSELASFKKVKDKLEEALIEPSNRSVEAILAYAKSKSALHS
jgi:hypothetical protein